MKYQWEEGEVSILIQLQFCPLAQTIPFENSRQHRGCWIAENTHTHRMCTSLDCLQRPAVINCLIYKLLLLKCQKYLCDITDIHIIFSHSHRTSVDAYLHRHSYMHLSGNKPYFVNLGPAHPFTISPSYPLLTLSYSNMKEPLETHICQRSLSFPQLPSYAF